MSLHPELVELQRRLEGLGVVAVEHPDHLCVRLPLICSVRVRYDGARLTTEPRFGALGRTRATAVLMGGGATAVGTLLSTRGVTPTTLAVGLLVGLAASYEVMRYVLTESTVTRVQTLWLARHADAAAAAPARVGARGVRELGVPTPAAGVATMVTPARDRVR